MLPDGVGDGSNGLKISGVGARTALSVLSGLSVAELAQAVALQEATRLTKIPGIGKQPYDGFVTPSGRHYIAGLFGEDGLALVDLWNPAAGARRVLNGYGRGEEPLPVYKMPHLRGWAVAGRYIFLPGRKRGALRSMASRCSRWPSRARAACG